MRGDGGGLILIHLKSRMKCVTKGILYVHCFVLGVHSIVKKEKSSWLAVDYHSTGHLSLFSTGDHS